MRLFCGILVDMGLIVLAMALLAMNTDYVAEIEKWRAARAERLKAEDGWLSLVGLAWLKPGSNRIGSAADAEVQLPKRMPARVAVITYANGKTHIKAENGVTLRINGNVTKEADLRSDAGGNEPDIVEIADGVKLFAIHRGTQDAIRIKDKNSVARLGFKGLDWYPVKPQWRINAKWVKDPRPIAYQAMAGDPQKDESPGYAEFVHAGKTYRLIATIDTGELFFVIRDKTAGKTTYPAARFVKAPIPKDNTVTLDFNKAYNPPCVFTPYATCPLPPPQNRLPFAIEAGERMYKDNDQR